MKSAGDFISTASIKGRKAPEYRSRGITMLGELEIRHGYGHMPHIRLFWWFDPGVIGALGGYVRWGGG